MAKLYFKYGAMGSSKTAQALITRFNYEERGMSVWLLKPETDRRDSGNRLVSRVGLSAEAESIPEKENITERFIGLGGKERFDVIIADEAQFFTPKQIEEFREIVDECNIPVLCFGLRTDFLTHTFPGSLRLLELADSVSEIKTICTCGEKAIVNARIDADGRVITSGAQVFLGGNDSYIAMCHRCWKRSIKEQRRIL